MLAQYDGGASTLAPTIALMSFILIGGVALIFFMILVRISWNVANIAKHAKQIADSVRDEKP